MNSNPRNVQLCFKQVLYSGETTLGMSSFSFKFFKAGWEGAGKGGRPHKYARGAVNGEREIKQMEFVLKNSTITLF